MNITLHINGIDHEIEQRPYTHAPLRPARTWLSRGNWRRRRAFRRGHGFAEWPTC